MGLEAGEVGQLVDAFLSDHGQIHVGEQQLLAAVGLRLHHHIDGKFTQRCAQTIRNCANVLGAAKADVGGHFVEQPLRLRGEASTARAASITVVSS
jgi:hypothetical protein